MYVCGTSGFHARKYATRPTCPLDIFTTSLLNIIIIIIRRPVVALYILALARVIQASRGGRARGAYVSLVMHPEHRTEDVHNNVLVQTLRQTI